MHPLVLLATCTRSRIKSKFICGSRGGPGPKGRGAGYRPSPGLSTEKAGRLVREADFGGQARPRSLRHFAEMALPVLRHFAEMKLPALALALGALSACSTRPPERFGGDAFAFDQSYVWRARIQAGKDLRSGLD